jgi:23S rRNA (uracil1939-C5)-methyltransferase
VGHIKIRLGPKSFYQTNSEQAVNLYKITEEFASSAKTDILYDLFSGVGSIGLFLANASAKVIGIETVAESVKEAELNKEINNIPNARFFVGQVEDVFNEDFIDEHGKPGVVVIDPPRPGVHKHVIAALLSSEVPRIVYVSCNPSTQARDIALLSDKYKVTAVQPVDMFPHTLHVENVALLELK